MGVSRASAMPTACRLSVMVKLQSGGFNLKSSVQPSVLSSLPVASSPVRSLSSMARLSCPAHLTVSVPRSLAIWPAPARALPSVPAATAVSLKLNQLVTQLVKPRFALKARSLSSALQLVSQAFWHSVLSLVQPPQRPCPLSSLRLSSPAWQPAGRRQS